MSEDEARKGATGQARPKRRRSLRLRLLVGVLGLLVGFGVGEVAVRILGLGTATLTRGVLHAYHAEAGWSCAPDLDTRYIQPGSFDVRVTTNAEGLRDGPIELRKPVGVRRVVILGDSFMWGYGVEDDEMFASRLQAKVPGTETVNLGANGYSTVQQAIRLEVDGVAYAPDLVVAAFTWNDLDDNLDDKDGGRPVIRAGDDGALRIANRPVRTQWKNPLKQWCRHNSRLFSFLEYCGANWKAAREATRSREEREEPANRHAEADGAAERRPRRARVNTSIDRPATALDVFGTPTPLSEHAWAVYETALQKIRDDARAAGADLLVVNNAAREALFPAALRMATGVEDADAARFGIDVERPNQRLAEITERLGVAYVDGTPAFAAHPEPQSLFLVDNGHWSAAGHAVMVEAVAPEVARMLER